MKVLSDGSVYLPRHDPILEKDLDSKYERQGNERIWKPKFIWVDELKDKHKGKVFSIIGKGPSLDFLKAENLKGPIICINEAIHVVEKLYTGDDLYCVTQDYELKNSCEPKNATLLLTRSNYAWYKDYNKKYCFDLPNDLSACNAIRIAESMGASAFKMFCFDACTNGSIDYANSIGHDPSGDASRFKSHRKLIETVTKLPIDWLSGKKHKNFRFKTIVEIIQNLQSDTPVVFMPYFGEFGWYNIWHLRLVDKFKAQKKLVCCKVGHECLFPTADSFIYDWKDPLTDFERSGVNPEHDQLVYLKTKYPLYDYVPSNLLARDQELKIPREMFQNPIQIKPKKIRNLNVDIVLGCRKRERVPERNWKHWLEVTDLITSLGLSYAIVGQRETSYDFTTAKYRSWEYPDMDACVELMQCCSLYIGTDTGISHFASNCQVKERIIFRYPDGGNCIHYMNLVNKKPLQFLEEGWKNKNVVIKAIKDWYERNK